MSFWFWYCSVFGSLFIGMTCAWWRSSWADHRAARERRWLEDLIEDIAPEHAERSRLMRKMRIVSEGDHKRALFWGREPTPLYPREIQLLLANELIGGRR